MERLDHLLFRADTDVIGYIDALPMPSGDCHHCACFARFLASQARSLKDVRRASEAVELIMESGGWNAEQLRSGFFPTLNRELKEEGLRSSFYESFGTRSKAEWKRLQTSERLQVI